MKPSKLKFNQLNKQTPSVNLALSMIIATTVVLMTLGALNGAALSTGVWDALVSTLKSLLSSTWVYALALIALVAAVWQIAHGRGYATLATILGLLAVALIGPGMATSMATATHAPISFAQTAIPVSNPLPLVLRAAR